MGVFGKEERMARAEGEVGSRVGIVKVYRFVAVRSDNFQRIGSREEEFLPTFHNRAALGSCATEYDHVFD